MSQATGATLADLDIGKTRANLSSHGLHFLPAVRLLTEGRQPE